MWTYLKSARKRLEVSYKRRCLSPNQIPLSRIFVERTQYCQFGVVGNLFKDLDSQFGYLFANGAGSLPLRLSFRYVAAGSLHERAPILEKFNIRSQMG